MIKTSFTLRVLVINFLLLALPLLIDSFIFFQNSYYEAITDAKKELKEDAHLRTYTFLSSEPVRQVLLSELAYVLNIQDGMSNQDFAKVSQKLTEIARSWGDYQISVIAHGTGGFFKILAASEQGLVDTYFQSYRQIDRVFKQGSGTFLRYLSTPDSSKLVPHLFVARTITSKKTGEPIAILLVSSSIEKQLKVALAPDTDGGNTQFALLNADGIVFKSSDPKLMGQYFKPLSEQRIKEIMLSGQLGTIKVPPEPLPVIPGKDFPYFEFIFNDLVQIAYMVDIPELRLAFLTYSAKEEFFGSAVRHFLLIYTIYGLILLLGGGVTYWLSLWISRPLRQLTHVMGQVSQGNRNVRFQEAPFGFEINILGRMFNQTMDTLFQQIQKAADERVKKETYQRELNIGRQVQRSLLPASDPAIHGASVAGAYLPASEVGGDFYAYLQKRSASGEEMLALMVADVAGKGISSCLYSLSARSLCRAYTTLSDDVGHILSKTNNAFIRDTTESGMFITMIFGFYHIQSRTFVYYSCGHIPCLVKRADGHIEMLKSTGIALGLTESQDYIPSSIQLYPGDTLVLFTDGLLEAENTSHEQFTEKRLIDLLQSRTWNTAQEIVDVIAGVVQEFTSSIPQDEEVIVVALKVE